MADCITAIKNDAIEKRWFRKIVLNILKRQKVFIKKSVVWSHCWKSKCRHAQKVLNKHFGGYLLVSISSIIKQANSVHLEVRLLSLKGKWPRALISADTEPKPEISQHQGSHGPLHRAAPLLAASACYEGAKGSVLNRRAPRGMSPRKSTQVGPGECLRDALNSYW